MNFNEYSAIELIREVVFADYRAVSSIYDIEPDTLTIIKNLNRPSDIEPFIIQVQQKIFSYERVKKWIDQGGVVLFKIYIEVYEQVKGHRPWDKLEDRKVSKLFAVYGVNPHKLNLGYYELEAQ